MSTPAVADTGEPQYINQYATDVVALEVSIGGVVADPDDQSISVAMIDEGGEQVFTRQATRAETGVYEVQLDSTETAIPGTYTITWLYAVNGVTTTYVVYIQIGPFSAAYAKLSAEMRAMVDRVMIRFQDMFDSPQGGPHLSTYWQSRFNRGRVADLLAIALGRLNTAAQPYQTYSLEEGVGAPFPVDQWGPLLEQATAVEVYKHLRRSYLEQPMLTGGDVTRHDRRDYFDRWGQLLADEERNLKDQLDVFKIRNMMLGQPRVLVSGGVFGRYGPNRFRAGSAAPRGYFMWRVGW